MDIDIPAGDGKIVSLFLQCMDPLTDQKFWANVPLNESQKYEKGSFFYFCRWILTGCRLAWTTQMGLEPMTYGSKVLGEYTFENYPESMKKALFYFLSMAIPAEN